MLSAVNKSVGEGGWPDAIRVEGRRVAAAEVEERWSFGGSKAPHRWLGHAIDQLTGVVLAWVVGSRADEVLGELQKRLKPFGLGHFSTAAAGVYERQLPPRSHRWQSLHAAN